MHGVPYLARRRDRHAAGQVLPEGRRPCESRVYLRELPWRRPDAGGHGRGARRQEGLHRQADSSADPGGLREMPQRRGPDEAIQPVAPRRRALGIQDEQARADAGPGRPARGRMRELSRRTWDPPDQGLPFARLSHPDRQDLQYLPRRRRLDGLLPPPLGRLREVHAERPREGDVREGGPFGPHVQFLPRQPRRHTPGSLLRRQRLRNVPFRFAEKFKESAHSRAFADMGLPAA